MYTSPTNLNGKIVYYKIQLILMCLAVIFCTDSKRSVLLYLVWLLIFDQHKNFPNNYLWLFPDIFSIKVVKDKHFKITDCNNPHTAAYGLIFINLCQII